MITVRMEGVEDALKVMDHKTVYRAARLALNKATTESRKAASQKISDRWNINKSRINKELKTVRLARVGLLQAVVEVRGEPIPLIHFGAKQVRSFKSGKKEMYRVTTARTSTVQRSIRGSTGVSVNIIRSKGAKTIKGAFLAAMPNGHLGVFSNVADFFDRDYEYHTPVKGAYKGKPGRTKIVERKAISIPEMFKQKKVWDSFVNKATTVWNQVFGSHLKG